MRGLLKRGIAAILAVAFLMGLGAGAANAQNDTANGFRISPVRQELTIEKGKNSTFTITIENPTEAATVAKPIVNDFIASEKENGEPRLILDNEGEPPKNSFRSLVQNIGDVPLGPKEKKDIPVRINVPADANAGGYYGAIRFVPSVVNNEGNVSLTASVGTIVLVTVPGNLTQRLDLLKLGAGRDGNFKSFFTSGDVQVLTRLKNTGDIHVQPFGKVTVKNMFGKTVYEFELNQAKSNVLPDSIRKYENSIGKPKGGLGRYTIEANLGYSQGSGDLISAKASFWYVPAWALILLLILLAAIAVGIYTLARRFRGAPNHRAKRR